MIYIAKKDTWFKEGTEVKVVDDCIWPEIGTGLFEGIIVLDQDKIDSGQSGQIGEEKYDQEICLLDEFDTISIMSG